MSFRKEQYLNFKKLDLTAKRTFLAGMNETEIRSLFLEVLNNGIHGFCFSLYADGQEPGDIIGEEQIRRRMEILKPHTKWIRTFSCIEGNELIPVIAKEYGIKTMVGAWLGDDLEKNEEEIAGLLDLAKKGYVDIAAVGNEVLYRKELTEEELLKYIQRVKKEIPEISVGYVDAYYEFVKRPNIADISDVILCNCYPYWEGTSYEDSLAHMQHMFNMASQAAKGKPVIITETGWPSQGEALGGAIPSDTSAMKYFINANLWAQDDDVDLMYFSSFDESWKVSSEGSVGAYWGVWDKLENLKYVSE